MILYNSEWFLLGAFAILLLYFLSYYLTNRSERYNFYFALGCLASIVRIVFFRILNTQGAAVINLTFDTKILHLQFIWAPFIYILLADSLFPGITKKLINNIIITLVSVLSLFIIFVPEEVIPYDIAYDYVIMSQALYSMYIFIVALIKKIRYSTALFIVSVSLMLGLTHDVLNGSGIISTSLRDIHPYFYLAFLLVASVVSAKRQILMDKRRMESQIKFLNAQIQPHFLYNTINTITAYCRTDPEKSRQLLLELSTYLRGKFKGNKNMVTSLKNEIELIKSYLTIEQVRFNDRLTVEYDIDEDINVLIPCLILQPIVENAVKHGLIPKKEGGKIEISVRKQTDNIVVKIKDNGIGMDETRLPEILDGRHEGIGLSNTNERLKRYYNTQIEMESKIGKGTEFTVIIPMSGGQNQ